MFKKISSAIFSLSLILISGCSQDAYVKNELSETTRSNMQLIDKNYKDLTKYVENKNKKGIYEQTLVIALERLSKENNDSEAVSDMISRFNKDMLLEGSIFHKYKNDYNDFINDPIYSTIKDNKDLSDIKIDKISEISLESNRLRQFFNVKKYDESFIDYINIIAGLSQSVDSVIVEKSELSTETGVGNQFVGNKQYGSWKTNQNGDMYWEFLQTYMFLSFLDNAMYSGYRGGYSSYRGNYGYNKYSNRYKYNNWSNNRSWSYYNDKYVKDYAKPKEKKAYNKNYKTAQTKYKSSFSKNKNLESTNKKISSNKKYKSSFAKTPTRNTTTSKAYGNKYKSTKSSPNIRNSSTNRSIRKGK
jgi:hypothetical protein